MIIMAFKVYSFALGRDQRNLSIENQKNYEVSDLTGSNITNKYSGKSLTIDWNVILIKKYCDYWQKIVVVRSGIRTHALIRGPECSLHRSEECISWVWRLRPLGHPDFVRKYVCTFDIIMLSVLKQIKVPWFI